MRLPPPDHWRVRLVHGLVGLGAAPLRLRYGPEVPTHRLREPPAALVPTPRGAFATYTWGGDDAPFSAPVPPRGAPRASPRPPVLLVHGLNANARYWSGTASLLGEARRVIAFDQRRHGETGPLPGGVSLPETREDLRAVTDALGLPVVDLVGHSWGGKVCLDFAAAHPERIRRLALVDPVPPQGLHPVIRRAGLVASAIFALERGPFPDAASLAAAADRICWLRHAAPWARRAFLASFRRAGPADAEGATGEGPYHHALDDASFHGIYDEVLGRPSPLSLAPVRMPVLLLRASFSAMPFASEVSWLARRLPALTHGRLPGEHSLHIVNPAGLAAALARFLDG